MNKWNPNMPPAVLQIVPELDAGGAERSTVDIAKALAERGVRALVATQGGRLERELIAGGGELLPMPVASKHPLRMYLNAGRIANIIRTQNVLLVHARSRAPAWSALLAARRTGVPFVTTYHGVYNARGAMKRWYNSVMARGDAVIANSNWTARHILATYRFAPKRLIAIPRGLDLDVFNPSKVEPDRIQALRNWWGMGAAVRVILLPGRLTRWKGQLVLVRALARLKREGRLPPDVRAVIAGDSQGRTAYLKEIVGTIAQEGLEDVVVVSDHINDMAAAYLAANIVVSASTDPEAFGRVAPEAAAMERPVVATDHGGARETILPGESGLLVTPGSASALAEALAELLARSPEELAAMGRKGRAHIEAHYTVERMCETTLELYRELIEARLPG